MCIRDRPIGHNVTVEGAKSVNINIKFTLTIDSGFETEFIIEQAKEKIEEYFGELRASWENEGSITVRKSRIEMKVLEVDGVIDIENITLNDNTETVSYTHLYKRQRLCGYCLRNGLGQRKRDFCCNGGRIFN